MLYKLTAFVLALTSAWVWDWTRCGLGHAVSPRWQPKYSSASRRAWQGMESWHWMVGIGMARFFFLIAALYSAPSPLLLSAVVSTVRDFRRCKTR